MRVIELFGRRQTVFNDEYEVMKIIHAKRKVRFEDLSDRHKEIVQNLYLQNIIQITDDGVITLNTIRSIN